MSLPLLQFEAVFNRDDIRKVVEVYNDRWARGGLQARGANGRTKYEWFETTTAEERVEEVYQAAQGLKAGTWAWPQLLQVLVPKDVKLSEFAERMVGDMVKRSGKSKKPRRICMADPVAQAMQFLLADAINPYIEQKLSKHALAYRKARPLPVAFKNVVRFARDKKLYAVAVVDIETFFDAIRWELLDEVLRGLGVDAFLVAALQTLCRVQVLDAKGRVVLRDGGVPQGLVIAPSLANLFLAAFDVRVQRIIGQWGVYLWRYGDDIALFARDRNSLQKAIATVKTELGQLHLRVKAGTGALKDMMNPENLPVWVGFKFSHESTWAAPEKLQLKVRHLLDRLDRGDLDDLGVVRCLDQLQDHYEHVLLSTQAGEAIAEMETVLLAHLTPPRKENIDSIRKQLRARPREMETSTSTPNGVGQGEVPFEEVHLYGRDGETWFPFDTCGPCPHGPGTHEGPPRDSLGVLLHHNGNGVRVEVVPLQENVLPLDREVEGANGLEASLRPTSVEVSGEGGPLGGRSSGAVPSSYSLDRPRDPSRPPTSSDPAGHPRTRKYKRNSARLVAAAIECPWTVVVHGHAGPVEATSSKGDAVVLPLNLPAAKSSTEVHLEGYRVVLHRLRAEGALCVVVKVTDRTLEGFVGRGWAISRPHLLRRWRQVVVAVDEMLADGAGIWFELRDGRRFHAGRRGSWSGP